MQYRSWFAVSIFNFLVAGIFGVVMRLAFVTELNWLDYRNLMHGHSHVAMLGWLYLSIVLLFVRYFINDKRISQTYQYLFILTEVSVVGMAISFPLQGYGVFSIIFSIMHVLVSYAFTYRFFKDLKKKKRVGISVLFAKTALIFMILSTLALFAMGPIMALDMRSSDMYYMAVQFFLHFQFNGWFIFGALALFFRMAEEWNIIFPKQLSMWFYNTLFVSCILTYALAVTWSNPSSLLFLINSTGTIIQLSSLFLFFILIFKRKSLIYSKMTPHIKALLLLAFTSFSIKILVQSAVVIPAVAKICYTIRNYVIGFIHLLLLGVITFIILGLAYQFKFLNKTNKMTTYGATLLAIGVILSESLLFFQGTLLWAALGFIPYYYEVLFGISTLMPVGILMIIISLINENKMVNIKNEAF